MPVSVTAKAMTAGARLSASWWALQPRVAASSRRRTSPRSVNLKALESRLRSTCSRRFLSVRMAGGRSGARSTVKLSPLFSATGSKVRSTYSWSSGKGTSLTSTVMVPDSILAMSRMSLISDRRSEPEA